VVRFGNGYVSYARIADEKPIWQIAFLLNDPDNGMEEGLPVRAGRLGPCRVR
jgi:hypothetical protein